MESTAGLICNFNKFNVSTSALYILFLDFQFVLNSEIKKFQHLQYCFGGFEDFQKILFCVRLAHLVCISEKAILRFEMRNRCFRSAGSRGRVINIKPTLKSKHRFNNLSLKAKLPRFYFLSPSNSSNDLLSKFFIFCMIVSEFFCVIS